MSRIQAAALTGLSPTGFDKARREGKYPGPTLPGGKFDRTLIEKAMDRMSGIDNTIQQVASVTGHSLKTVTGILEKYLARTRGLSDAAIMNFENSPRTDFANRLQTSTPMGKSKNDKS